MLHQYYRMLNRNHMRKGVVGTILAGLLITAFPALAVGIQNHRLHNGTTLRLNVEAISFGNSHLVPQHILSTPLNRISTSHLSGENNFIAGDQVFVFMSPGPDNIWYPYAISKRPPDPGCGTDQCLAVKGHITDIARDSLKINYGFETFVLPQLFQDQDVTGERAEIKVQIDETGHSTLRALTIGSKTFDQRNLLNWAPPGWSSFGANKAPAINPPK